MDKQYCVYIMSNKWNTVVYTGITSNLQKRVSEHKEKAVDGFTRKYNVSKLVYYEVYGDPETAITREKQIKSWSRQKKNDLIESANEVWRDLSDEI